MPKNKSDAVDGVANLCFHQEIKLVQVYLNKMELIALFNIGQTKLTQLELQILSQLVYSF